MHAPVRGGLEARRESGGLVSRCPFQLCLAEVLCFREVRSREVRSREVRFQQVRPL